MDDNQYFTQDSLTNCHNTTHVRHTAPTLSIRVHSTRTAARLPRAAGRGAGRGEREKGLPSPPDSFRNGINPIYINSDLLSLPWSQGRTKIGVEFCIGIESGTGPGSGSLTGTDIEDGTVVTIEWRKNRPI
ncbi:hypothetical protein EVAR_65158_1 [Eumeta japonica]|uniref:Uncharacterized protein n=1 Tax=Eumeta variegata TaxID=151549 RepID=A0A4C2AC85_EUMVA|nr:hypothetical protein EVAR_65158_1 [Eumeta japonica]